MYVSQAVAYQCPGRGYSDKTYESKHVDGYGTDGMGDSSHAKDLNIGSRSAQIPQEITSGKGLGHARGPRIAVNAIQPIHALPLLVVQDDPK